VELHRAGARTTRRAGRHHRAEGRGVGHAAGREGAMVGGRHGRPRRAGQAAHAEAGGRHDHAEPDGAARTGANGAIAGAGARERRGEGSRWAAPRKKKGREVGRRRGGLTARGASAQAGGGFRAAGELGGGGRSSRGEERERGVWGGG
jgi:hypothetical protein